MKTTVIVYLEIVGYHYWDKAHTRVSYLSNVHRHVFTIRVGFSANHGDRQVEIFMKSDNIKEYLIDCYEDTRYAEYGACNFEGMSCEQIAGLILTDFAKEGAIWCEVLEDGKGGARVEL